MRGKEEEEQEIGGEGVWMADRCQVQEKVWKVLWDLQLFQLLRDFSWGFGMKGKDGVEGSASPVNGGGGGGVGVCPFFFFFDSHHTIIHIFFLYGRSQQVLF